MQLQRRTTTDTGIPRPEVPTTLPSAVMMRRETPKIPKLRLDLLLYTNMGAEALAKYQSGNQTVGSWYQRQTSERNTRHWMGHARTAPG